MMNPSTLRPSTPEGTDAIKPGSVRKFSRGRRTNPEVGASLGSRSSGFDRPAGSRPACMFQPVAQPWSKLRRRKIWDRLGARTPNMGVKYAFRPFMRQG
jgi:hypothetical protein